MLVRLSLSHTESRQLCGGPFCLAHKSVHVLPSYPDPTTIADYPIPRQQVVKYLGVTLCSNLSWSDHVQEVFNKVRRLTFFTLKLRKLSVTPRIILQFITACILPLWLYCSPVLFPGLKVKDFTLLARSLNIISRCSNITRGGLVQVIVNKHITSCDTFCAKVPPDPSHPLHVALSQATRANYRLIYARTNAYRNTLVPYLARLLVCRDQVIKELESALSR